MQSKPTKTNYSYAQAVKTLLLQDIIKQNNTQIQNSVQEQQTNDIELKNMVKDFVDEMDSMLNILTILITKHHNGPIA